RVAACGERREDEERMATRLAVELVSVDIAWLRELRDGDGRQRHELQSCGPLTRSELAEHDPQERRALELVVTVRTEDERRERLQPAAEQPQDVERRLVGPVEVLEHEDRRGAAAQLLGQRRDELMRQHVVRDHVLQLRKGEQRTERTLREQRIAIPPENTPCPVSPLT